MSNISLFVVLAIALSIALGYKTKINTTTLNKTILNTIFKGI